MPTPRRDRILRALARVLWQIGSWLLRKLARWSYDRVATYVELRAGAFDDEADELTDGPRQRWLRSRAERWRSVARWLRRHWPRAAEALRRADEAARRIVDDVPELVPDEAPGFPERKRRR